MLEGYGSIYLGIIFSLLLILLFFIWMIYTMYQYVAVVKSAHFISYRYIIDNALFWFEVFVLQKYRHITEEEFEINGFTFKQNLEDSTIYYIKDTRDDKVYYDKGELVEVNFNPGVCLVIKKLLYKEYCNCITKYDPTVEISPRLDEICDDY